MNNEWWVDLAKLDHDQKGILGLSLDEDHLILGPPGSGKTNLLLLRANYVAKLNPNILVVVFGRTLREFLARGAGQYKFGADRIKTSARCFYDILREYGRSSPAESLPFEEVRKELVERVRALRADLNSPPFDAVFLDEAQDFLPDEIEVFKSLSKRFFAVADSRQQLYRGGACLKHFEQVCNVHTLRYHYRNGVNIRRLADSIGAGMPSYIHTLPTCRYDEDRMPSSVEWHELDFERQVKAIVGSITIQTKAFPNEMLAIICPTNSDVKRMHAALESTSIGKLVVMQNSVEGYSTFDPSKPVCLTTMHGCKGLEFRAVHGAMMESLRRFPLQRNLIFTLTTRAKTTLSLYGDPIPPFVKSAILAVEPAGDLPPISSAFGGDVE